MGIGYWIVGGLSLLGVFAFFLNEYEKKEAHSNSALPDDFAGNISFIGRSGAIALDTDRKRIAIRCPNGWEVCEFSKVVGAELEIGGKTVTRTTGSRSLTGAAIGGLTFGIAGAVVGGLGGGTKSVSQNVTENVKIRITLDDMASPIREVEFRYFDWFWAAWEDEGTAIKHANEWMARINMIVEGNQKVLV